MSPEFGAKTGNVLSARDVDSQRSDMVMFRMMFAVAAALEQEADPVASAQWQEVKSKMYGEQLATIAAVSAGSTLVYGDRPKDITYKRLVHMCSAAELDAAYGARQNRNMREMLGMPKKRCDDGLTAVPERVLLAEREAVLCHSVQRAARSAAADSSVVALVGLLPCLLLCI